MSGTQRSPDAPDEQPQAGVLGNLPRSRPGRRSPRRGDPAPSDSPAASEEPSAAQPERPAATGSSSELEALARVGIGVAGSAVSVGLRIAARAAGTVRDAIERR